MRYTRAKDEQCHFPLLYEAVDQHLYLPGNYFVTTQDQPSPAGLFVFSSALPQTDNFHAHLMSFEWRVSSFKQSQDENQSVSFEKVRANRRTQTSKNNQSASTDFCDIQHNRWVWICLSLFCFPAQIYIMSCELYFLESKYKCYLLTRFFCQCSFALQKWFSFTVFYEMCLFLDKVNTCCCVILHNNLSIIFCLYIFENKTIVLAHCVCFMLRFPLCKT